MRVYITFILFSLLAFNGCSSTKTGEPKELEENKSESAISLDTPETELLENAKKYYYSGLYSLAKENFDTLRRGYPLSAYKEFATLKSADCLFETGEYAEASKEYEEFVKAHPSSSSADYALFRAADGLRRSHTGVGRDTSPLERSLELLNTFVKDYPQSPYIQTSRELRAEIVKLLTEHEKRISRFYEKKENEPALTARQKAYDAKWVPVLQSTSVAKMNTDAPSPDGFEVAEAAKLENRPEMKASLDTSSDKTSEEQISEKRERILKIECQTGESSQLLVHFSSMNPIEEYRKGKEFEGDLTLELKDVASAVQSSDCFGKEDLSISEDGTIRLTGIQGGTIMTLNNPSRLLISIKR